MKQRPTPTSAGILITQDSYGVYSVRLGPGVQARARRAAKVALAVMDADTATAGVEAAALCALDGIKPSELASAAENLGQVYTWRDLPCLEWKGDDPPRVERRALHPRTVRLLSAKGVLGHPRPDGIEAGLATFIDRQIVYADIPRSGRVAEFERDLLCWWYQCLPMPLFFHVAGVQRLSAVTRACLASSDRDDVPALSSVDGDPASYEVDEDNSCAELLDVMNLSTGEDASSIVLQQALEHLSLLEHETDAASKRRWIGSLLGLRMLAARTGPITALLLAWSIDLIESGTPRQPNPPRTTPYGYLRRALLPLFHALRALSGSPDSWSTDELASNYEVLISSQSPGNQSTMCSALMSFHRFLQEWFDVPALKHSLHSDVPLPEVRAIVIWPHRLEMARAWVPAVTDDPTLAECLRVVLAITGEAPSRAKEVLFLRLGNVHDRGHCIEIEVTPSWRKDRLKTHWSQRRLYVRKPDSMEVIRAWVKRVEALKLGPNVLLFSDPQDRKSVYRRAQMSRAMARLLRAASGDPRAVGHSLRHSVISLAVEPDLHTSSLIGIDRFRKHAVAAGHATGTTTFVSYSHLYEAALRQWLDAALIRFVKLSGKTAANLLGVSEAAFRQKVFRRGIDAALLGWSLVSRSADDIQLPLASDGWVWIAATPPKPITASKADMGASVTLILLSRIEKGSSPAEVADAFMLDRQRLQRLAACAVNVIKTATARVWIRKIGAAAEELPGVPEAMKEFGVTFDAVQHRKLTDLNAWLQVERDPDLLKSAVKSWLACRRGLYLGLDEPRAINGLYRLLAESGLDPGLLRIGIRSPSFEQPSSDLRTTVERDFVTVFGIKPRIFPCAPRVRVPQSYLQIDALDTAKRQHGRAGSLAGLDAMLIATAAHLHWQEP